MRRVAFILLLLWSYTLWAQKPHYTKTYFNQFDGLLTQTVNSIENDGNGGLLIASENGLFLFDGKQFTRPAYVSQIKSKRIDDILPIAPGEYLLLGGNTNGVYYIKNNEIVWKEAIEGARNIQQLVSYSPPTNTLYFKRGTKLYKKEAGTNQASQLVYDNENIISFSTDYAGDLYVWDSYDLKYIKDGTQKAIYTPTLRSREWAVDLIWRYLLAKNGNLIAWGQDTIMTIKDGKILSKLYQETPDHLVVRDVREFEDGSIWYANQSGDLLEFDGKKVYNHKARLGLDDHVITSAYRDKNRTMWLGTIGQGLLMIRPSDIALVENSADTKINCFVENDNHLLVGTENGIYLVGDNALKPLTKGVDFAADMEDVFFSNYTHQLNYHDDYWLVSTIRTRVRFRYVWEVRNILGQKAVIKNGPSSAIFNGIFYTGFWGSFSIRTISQGGVGEQIRFKPKHNLGRTNRFLEVKDGVLAICDFGIYHIAENKGLIDTTCVLPANSLGKDNTYNDLIITDSNWYVSTSNGVFAAKYSSEAKAIDSIQQLSFVESYALCQTPDGALWSGTLQGLLKYSNGQLESFTFNEDIDQRRVTSLFYSDRRQRLFVGTIAGLYHFDPKKKKQEDKLFKLVRYKINYLEKDSSNFDEIELGPNENTFSIEADFINFLSNTKARLVYAIDGQTAQLATDNTAIFNSLESGDHAFRIWGETEGGQKTNERQFQITILPPFWQRTEGILLFLVSLGLIFWVTATIRLRQVKKRAQLEQEAQLTLNQLERKALNLSLNPHFLFNSLNSIQSRISQHNDEDLVNYIADFSNLMRRTLENSERNTISLEEEVNVLEHYLRMEQRRYRGRFDFEVKLDSGVEELEAEIPPMLLQPFVENSIIHGILPSSNKGLIEVFITHKDGFLIFEITDNGVGIMSSSSRTKHEPKAIGITKKRIMLLHEDNTLELMDLSKQNDMKQGMRVTIKLKLESDGYQ